MRNIADLPGSAVQTLTAGAPPRRAAWRDVVARGVGLLARYEKWLFAAMVVIQLVPIWAFTYLPTTDGAAHVANADVMRKYDDPAVDVFRKYYFVAKEPTPNLVGHLLLAGFQAVLSPTASEKLLVSIYVVLLPLGVRYGLRSIRRSATPLAFLAFPMVYNYLFAQGFYNFVTSIGMFFVVVGYWIRNRDRMDAKRGMVLGALALVLYACHLFSLALACGTIAMLAGWFALPEVRGRAFGRAAKQALVTGLALLPAVVLVVLFKPSTEWHSDEVYQWYPKEDLISLLQFRSMVSFREKEAWLGAALVTVMGALTLLVLLTKAARRSWSRWDVLLLVPIGLVGVYFKSYDARALHFYIPQRSMLYAFMTLLLWLAGQPIARRVKWAVVPAAVGLGVAFTASHALKYREFKPQLADFIRAGDEVKPNSTFLPLIFSPRGRTLTGHVPSIDVSPFYMASGYIAVRRDAVDLRNYEANTDHFPVRFRDELNPYKHLAVGDGFNMVPPKIDIERFRRKGGEVDYVLIWGLQDGFRAHDDTKALFAQLEKGYEKVDVPGVRQTEVWKRKGL